MENKFLEAALRYAARGLKVIPLKPGQKIPMIAAWQKNYSSEPAVIEKWWEKEPEANVGIVTGEVSGIIVVDVDNKAGKEGLVTLKKLEDALGKFTTLRSITQSGGIHLVFKHSTNRLKNSVDTLPGIDIRGENGQIVAPPSVVNGKSYCWEDETMQPEVMPPSLMKMLRQKENLLPVGVEGGKRNDSLFKYARKLWQAGFDEDTVIKFGLKCGDYCNPPLDHNEALAVIQSARKYVTAGQEYFDLEKLGIDWKIALPTEFVLNKGGVCIETEGGEYEWLSSPILVVGLTRDEHNENWGRRLLIADRDLKNKYWSMPMDLLRGDGTEIFGMLYNYGAEITPIRRSRPALLSYLQRSRTEKRFLCSTRIGWHGEQFVLPDMTIGDKKDPILLQSMNSAYNTYRVSGSVDEWKQNVAALCEGQSRLIFSLSSAFTPPLLDLLSEESGGVHLEGVSSIGKTTALRFASSVWGGSMPWEYILSWRATSNGLEGVAEAHCDTLLVLDEMGQVDSREVGQIAYMLANGQGKTRAGRDTPLRRQLQWRTFFISSGELSLADKMNEGGLKVRAGMETRLADVPADAGKGHGLFDKVPEGFDDAEQFARHIKAQSVKYYGTASRAFIQALLDNKEESVNFLKKVRAEFIPFCCPKEADGQVKRVAGRFALIAAAGELAIRLGIIPLKAGSVTAGVKTCFDSWLEERGGTTSADLIRAIKAIAHFIERYKDARFATPWEEDGPGRFLPDSAGYKRTVQGEAGWEYLLTPGTFQEILKGLPLDSIKPLLVEKKILIKGKGGKYASSISVPGSGSQRLYRISSIIHTYSEGVMDASDEAEELPKSKIYFD